MRWAIAVLPVSSLPQVDFPTVQVTTQLPGANPETMRLVVTALAGTPARPVPRAVVTMTSTSSFGVSQISLQFDLNRDIDGATQDVQAAINAAGSARCRATLPYPPTYSKVNPADAPVLTLALTSDTISLRDMSDLADTTLGPAAQPVSGVGTSRSRAGSETGGAGPGRLARLASYGLRMKDLRNAIVGANVAGPKGSLDGAQQSYTIAANDQITRPTPTAHHYCLSQRRARTPRAMSPSHRGLENDQCRRLVPGHACGHHRHPAPARRQRHRVRRPLNRSCRASARHAGGRLLTVVSDRTGTIRASVHDVQFTLVLSVGLVILVVLLFLRSLRATLIAGVALPLS